VDEAVAAARSNVGRTYLILGELPKSLDYYKQALELCRDSRDPRIEAITLNDVGAVYDTIGDKQQAVDYFNQAISSDPGFAAAYSGLADAYSILGAYGALSPKDAFLPSKAAAGRALEIDDTLAEACRTETITGSRGRSPLSSNSSGGITKSVVP
jgi:tetratricopeptide (TPR) repeat protein